MFCEEQITVSISGCAYLPKNKEEHIALKIHGTKGALFLDIEPYRERLTVKIDGDNISLEAELFSLDGKDRFYFRASKELKFASELGKEVGTILKKNSKNSYKK